MKLLYANVLRQGTADLVSIVTDLPEAVYPYIEPLTLDFRVAKGQAEAYLKAHFPELEVRELSHETRFGMDPRTSDEKNRGKGPSELGPLSKAIRDFRR